MNEDFRDVLRALLEAQAQFLIVGAYAVAAHGSARATGDLDLWVAPGPDSAERAVVDGLLIPFVGLATLLKNKRAVGRPQDLADVDALEARTGGKTLPRRD